MTNQTNSALDSVAQQIQSRTLQPQDKSALQSQESVPPRELIQWLWQMMSSMYGHKWVSSYGAEVDPDKVWASCLKGVLPEQIKHGLNRCATECHEWPPSAPEFRSLCLDWSEDSDIRWEHALQDRAESEWQQYRKALPNLTKKERAQAAGRKAIEEMKSLFGGSK